MLDSQYGLVNIEELSLDELLYMEGDIYERGKMSVEVLDAEFYQAVVNRIEELEGVPNPRTAPEENN